MGLYLCVFAPDGEEELPGARFPVLMSHSDSDGEWSPADAERLRSELLVIGRELAAVPPVPFEPGSWQARVAGAVGLRPSSLAYCFFDVDGEPLIGRLVGLADVAVDRDAPISFQ